METSQSMIPCFPAHGSSNGIQHLGWTPVGSSSVFQAFPWLWRGPQCLKVSTGCSEPRVGLELPGLFPPK